MPYFLVKFLIILLSFFIQFASVAHRILYISSKPMDRTHTPLVLLRFSPAQAALCQEKLQLVFTALPELTPQNTDPMELWEV